MGCKIIRSDKLPPGWDQKYLHGWDITWSKMKKDYRLLRAVINSPWVLPPGDRPHRHANCQKLLGKPAWDRHLENMKRREVEAEAPVKPLTPQAKTVAELNVQL